MNEKAQKAEAPQVLANNMVLVEFPPYYIY